ncbi:Na+/H+ antiporter NhaC family protein [Eubacteriales bacterium KG127]
MNTFKAIIKFLPVAVLAALMMSGIDALLAAPIATICATIVAALTEKLKFKEMIDAAVGSVSHILIALFILMFAYAMASAFMKTGVGASAVIIALSLGVTAKTVAVVGIAVTAILSVATGTSWGTFAACAPIFLWLNNIVGGDIVLTTCAIAGGACFGDNIGLISDTTIVSSGIQGVEVVDRIRTQGVWSIGCLLLAIVAFFVAGILLGLPSETADTSGVFDKLNAEAPDAIAYIQEKKPVAIDLLTQVQEGVALYMIIPLILVIGLAIAGVNTFMCIGSGIVSAYILGLFAGTTTFGGPGTSEDLSVYPFEWGRGLMDYLLMCKSGFADAGSWVVVMMMWVAAFGGIMAAMDAFAPLAKGIVALSGKVRTLMFFNGVLCIGGNMLLADEMAQIVTVGPIIKNVLEENVEASEEDMYKLKLRNATFGDAMGVFGSQLIPWHVYLAFYVGIAANVYPLFKFTALNFIQYNFMAMIAVASLLLLTVTGLDRFVPLFGLPREPQIKLKKHATA